MYNAVIRFNFRNSSNNTTSFAFTVNQEQIMPDSIRSRMRYTQMRYSNSHFDFTSFHMRVMVNAYD